MTGSAPHPPSSLASPSAQAPDRLPDLALVAVLLSHLDTAPSGLPSTAPMGRRGRAYERIVALSDGEWSVRISPAGEALVVTTAGDSAHAGRVVAPSGRGRGFVCLDGSDRAVDARREPAGWWVRCGGRRDRVWIRRPRVGELARVRPPVGDAPAVSFLTCPMPGVLTALYVAPEECVEAGQTLATLEAMKMENWLCADRPATVGRVLAEPGSSLAYGERVLELLPR